MASSPIVWTPDKRMILQSAVSDLSPDAFQDVVGKVFGPATLGKLSFGSPVLAKSWKLVESGPLRAVARAGRSSAPSIKVEATCPSASRR